MSPAQPRPSPPPHPPHRPAEVYLGSAAILRPSFDVLVGIAIVAGLYGVYKRRCRGAIVIDDSELEPPVINFARANSFAVESELGELDLVDAETFPSKDGHAGHAAPSDALCSGEARPPRHKKRGTRVSTDSLDEDDSFDSFDDELSPPPLGRVAAGRRTIGRLGQGLGGPPRLGGLRGGQYSQHHHHRLAETDEVDWAESDLHLVE